MGVMIILGGMVGVGIAALGYLQLQPGMSEPEVRQIMFLPTVALGFVEAATMVVLVLTVDEGRRRCSARGQVVVAHRPVRMGHGHPARTKLPVADPVATCFLTIPASSAPTPCSS